MMDMPHLLAPTEVATILEELGYDERTVEDVTPLVLPTARKIIHHCLIPLLLVRLHLDWIIFRGGSTSRCNHQGHFRAARAFSRGLLNGTFGYHFYRARKPTC